MNWFYSKGKKQEGPVTQEQLEEGIRSGAIKAEALVWEESFGSEWKPVSDIPELARWLPKVAVPALPVTTEQEPVAAEEASTIASAIATRPASGDFPRGGDFSRRAKEALSGKWGICIGVTLIYAIIIIFSGNLPLGSLLVGGPLMVGFSYFFIRVVRGQEVEVGQLFKGFGTFANAFGAYLLSGIFILLWSLLLIIPGIIAMFAYSQIYFLLADHPELSPMDAIRSSQELMKGRKGALFLLRLRFLGWLILAAIFTFGIGWLWVYPWWMAAEAGFYQELRNRQQPV